jgi:hypothetical protein
MRIASSSLFLRVLSADLLFMLITPAFIFSCHSLFAADSPSQFCATLPKMPGTPPGSLIFSTMVLVYSQGVHRISRFADEMGGLRGLQPKLFWSVYPGNYQNYCQGL